MGGEEESGWNRVMRGINRPFDWEDGGILYVVPLCSGVDRLVGVVSRESSGKSEKDRAWSGSRSSSSKALPIVTQDVVTACPVSFLN